MKYEEFSIILADSRLRPESILCFGLTTAPEQCLLTIRRIENPQGGHFVLRSVEQGIERSQGLHFDDDEERALAAAVFWQASQRVTPALLANGGFFRLSPLAQE